jgi:hypothetical protein
MRWSGSSGGEGVGGVGELKRSWNSGEKRERKSEEPPRLSRKRERRGEKEMWGEWAVFSPAKIDFCMPSLNHAWGNDFYKREQLWAACNLKRVPSRKIISVVVPSSQVYTTY